MKVRNIRGNLWEFSLGMWIHVRKEIILAVFFLLFSNVYFLFFFLFFVSWVNGAHGARESTGAF